MAEKDTKRTLGEIFSRYEPNALEADLFRKATDIRLRYDRNLKLAEVDLSLPRTYTKKSLYALEEHLREAYGFSGVRLLPHYDASLLSEAYLPEIITEAHRTGSVVNGFFSEYEYDWKEDSIEIRIPFSASGIELVDLGRVSDLIADIIRREFGVSMRVRISQSGNYSVREQEYLASLDEQIKSVMQAEAAENARIRAEKAAVQPAAAQGTSAEPELQLKHVVSLYEGSDTVTWETDSVIQTGKLRFDISSPSVLAGEVFPIENVLPIRALTGQMDNVIFLGEVANIEAREIKRSEKQSIQIALTDRDASIYLKTFAGSEAEAAEFLDTYKKGTPLAVHGNIKIDKFDGEAYCAYKDILKIKRIYRQDNAPEKRVELHLHTNLSAMDATIVPEDAVATASRWGHSAVAVTDHGNLQAFPRIMEKAEKIGGIKPIYGMEAYYVDDTARASFGGEDILFDDEFIFFDLETTGLSAQTCKIIEIGAVRGKGGEILERFDTFVDPGEPIPPEITKLTGITDEMVAGAPGVREALEMFFAFVGDRMLIAHNASFDTSFIRRAAADCDMPFKNPYLDTVSMSQYVNPDLNKHKLDTLANYFGLGDFNHHRASDDAEMLALIFFKMVDKLSAEGVNGISDLMTVMSEKCDPLKLKLYHLVILVKDQVGLKNLYQLVSDSYLTYYRKKPRIPKSRLQQYREGLLIGSACEAGELFQSILEGKPDAAINDIASFYDYFEIQPLANNRFMVREGKVADDEGLRDLNRRIVKLGEDLGKPVVATCDAHYLDPEDDIYRRILLSGQKFADGDNEGELYFRTTEEMLEEFSYLGEEKAYEVVVTNTQKIASRIGDVRPIPKGNYPPHIDGAEDELTTNCWKLAKELYGDPLPEVVSARLTRELDSIIKNGFAIMYIIARKLVENSESKGYQVGSRGSVGSSFVATMAGITRVNPLPPHYRCPKCRHTEFITDGSVKSGFDMPTKNCPDCGTLMAQDGHDIPFETFLGFYGDKTPDIDLNFSGDVQGDAHRFTEVLFGKGHAFKAGTIGTLASKTAYGYAMKYLESKGVMVNKAELDRLCSGCEGIKRTTGQHPGGIIVIPQEYEVTDFSPVQHPADDPNSDIVTTHFEFKYLHDTILKLDILGHDIPTKYKRLEEYTNTSVLDVPMNDAKVYKLFTSTEPLGVKPEAILSETGTLGLPEMGTRLSRNVLIDAQPKNFSDLLQIEGLTHGTGVWMGNADELIKSGICTISDVIGCRDDIMMTLIHKYGLEKSLAFKIMEFTRKNKKGLQTPAEMVSAMEEKEVPRWYIDSLQKIRYMFPKAHAAAYATDAIRLGWYKIYYPVEFYAAYFTAAPDGFDSEVVMGGPRHVRETMDAINKMGKDATQKDKDLADALLLVNEYYARGFQFLPVSLQKSHASKFLPEGGKIRLPFASLPGVGENAAISLMNARDEHDIFSIEGLKAVAKVPKSVIDTLERNGVFAGMSKTNQLSIF